MRACVSVRVCVSVRACVRVCAANHKVLTYQKKALKVCGYMHVYAITKTSVLLKTDIKVDVRH